MPLENSPEDHLTVQELAVIEQAARKYAEDAAVNAARLEAQGVLQRYVRRATAGFLILLVGLVVAIGLQQHDATTARQAIVKSGRVISVVGCNRDYNTIAALRSIIIQSASQIDQAVKDGQITPAQAQTYKDYNIKSLQSLPLPDCRTAFTVLTDNPDNLGRVPTPLYTKPKAKQKVTPKVKR